VRPPNAAGVEVAAFKTPRHPHPLPSDFAVISAHVTIGHILVAAARRGRGSAPADFPRSHPGPETAAHDPGSRRPFR
jgi:hypothetical protein